MMKSAPLVSVHIVTFNSAETIRACLDSVKAQRGVDFAVHIFDNGSTDNTLEQVRAANITITPNSQNIGYAAAHNALIETTDSQFVLTLNPDVRLLPNFLCSMTTALSAPLTERVGSAAGLLLRVDRLDGTPTTIDAAGLYMRRNRRQGLRLEGKSLADVPDQPTKIFGPDGAAAFYRRAMLNDVRLAGEVFDSDFFMHKEDIDLCWRAQLRGWSSLFVPSAMAHHIRTFRPGQRRPVTALLRFYAVRNRYLLMLKNERMAHLQRDLLPILFYELGIVSYLLLIERESLPAYRAAWTLRRQMLWKRRQIQETACVEWQELRHWFQDS